MLHAPIRNECVVLPWTDKPAAETAFLKTDVNWNEVSGVPSTWTNSGPSTAGRKFVTYWDMAKPGQIVTQAHGSIIKPIPFPDWSVLDLAMRTDTEKSLPT